MFIVTKIYTFVICFTKVTQKVDKTLTKQLQNITHMEEFKGTNGTADSLTVDTLEKAINKALL